MDRDTIFALLRAAKPELTARGVQSLAVFGSVARDTALPKSDLDLLVVFSRPMGLFEFVRLKQYLEEVTHCRVDLVTPDALRPEMKAEILKEAVDVQ
jgi:uncharacterized protein